MSILHLLPSSRSLPIPHTPELTTRPGASMHGRAPRRPGPSELTPAARLGPRCSPPRRARVGVTRRRSSPGRWGSACKLKPHVPTADPAVELGPRTSTPGLVPAACSDRAPSESAPTANPHLHLLLGKELVSPPALEKSSSHLGRLYLSKRRGQKS